nr:bradykinin potentiating peptide E [Gloydius blomhoffii]
EKWDPPPVSPP